MKVTYINNSGLNKFSFPAHQHTNFITGNINYMKINGKGTVRIQPDIAELVLGVITEGKELMEAQQSNSRIMESVISSLKLIDIPEKDIKTAFYSVDPLYDFIDGKQVFKGYKVTNALKIIIRDIQDSGKVIDKAVSSGANLVRGITFTVSELEIHYRTALSSALKNSLEKALDLEKTMQVRLNRIPIQIIEESSNIQFQENPMAYKLTTAATQIEPGETEITANINAVYVYYS